MTLSELATILNLSPSTISRTLNRPEMVAPGTRERVLSAAKAYGYRPNGIARSLRKGETPSIGVIVSDIQNPFYATIVRAIERVAAKHGYTVIVCNADENAENEALALNILAEMQVSGIIHSPTGANIEVLRRLSEAGMPIIEIDRVSHLKEADTVLLDNLRGAKEAAEHFLRLGHYRLAIITGPLHLTTGHDRLQGFEAALAGVGGLPKEYVEVGDFREASGYAATRRLLALAEPPTALFVANNEMMTGALAALKEGGVQIPEAISVISFDDFRWARYVEPPLTVIAQPTEEMGVTAAKLFFERLQGRLEPASRVLKPTLIERSSCALLVDRGVIQT